MMSIVSFFIFFTGERRSMASLKRRIFCSLTGVCVGDETSLSSAIMTWRIQFISFSFEVHWILKRNKKKVHSIRTWDKSALSLCGIGRPVKKFLLHCRHELVVGEDEPTTTFTPSRWWYNAEEFRTHHEVTGGRFSAAGRVKHESEITFLSICSKEWVRK